MIVRGAWRALHLAGQLAALLLMGVAPATLAAGAAPPGGSRPAARLAVGPVEGARAALTRQLAVDLCRSFTCVPFAAGTTAAGFDLARMRRAGVDGVLVGALKRISTGWILTLSLYTDTEFAEVTWRLPLDRRGALPATTLAELLEEVGARLSPPPPPPPLASAPRDPESNRSIPLPPPPTVGGVALAPSPPVAQPPAPGGRAATPATSPSSPALRGLPEPLIVSASGPGREVRPWLVLELGALLGRRQLTFQGAVAGPAPLRGHLAPLVWGAAARLEVFPGAQATHGGLGGLGLFGDYAASLGLETRADGASGATRLWSLSAGALWRSAPPGQRVALIPSLSYEARGATVRPAVAGLADTSLAGLRAGLRVEAPLGGAASFFAGGGATRWFTARDLIAGEVPSFPGGSAWAFDVEAGVGLRLAPPLEVRLAVRSELTSFTFEPDPEGIYRASGARDLGLSARLSARWLFP